MSEQVLYSHTWPGWCSSGMRDSAAIHSSGAAISCGCGGPCFSSLTNSRTAGNAKSEGEPYPARKLSRSTTVIGLSAGTTSSTGLAGVRTTAGDASSGSQRPTGSSSATCPSSISIITAAAVMGLVIEAMRKIESVAIGRVPSTSAEPAACTSTRSPRATSATAPGTNPFPTQVCKMSRRLLIDPSSWRALAGYLRSESPDRARGREDVDTSIDGMRSGRLPEQRTAPAAIGKQPPPEIGSLPRPADGPPRATHEREVQEHDGVRGWQPDIDDVVGPEVAIHDPRFARGELTLKSCPFVPRRRSQARPPEHLVQLDHRQAGDLAQAGGEGRFTGRTAAHDDYPLHDAHGANPARSPRSIPARI
jgi:hypothetical protein